jgi:hypothetical protein
MNGFVEAILLPFAGLGNTGPSSWFESYLPTILKLLNNLKTGRIIVGLFHVAHFARYS